MSYCRFLENDAYMYWSTGGFITCCGCIMSDTDPHFKTFSAAAEHLYEHRAAGHHINQYAFDGLEEDRAMHGDNVPEDDERD